MLSTMLQRSQVEREGMARTAAVARCWRKAGSVMPVTAAARATAGMPCDDSGAGNSSAGRVQAQGQA